MKIINMAKVILIAIIHAYPSLAFAEDSNDACNYSALENLEKVELSSLNKTKLEFLDSSTEGAEIYVYKKSNNEIISIAAHFYGETGDTEIRYYFKENRLNSYFVKLIDSYYTAPIYDTNSRVASKIINSFVVCNEHLPNYPNSDELNKVYSRAVNSLKKIVKNIQ